MLSQAAQHELVSLARDAVRDALERDGRQVPVDMAAVSDGLQAPGASFVTLRRGEELLGCIGTMEAARPLAADVAHNAWAAAFADPRLPAVTWDDYASMSVKISVLEPVEAMTVTDRADLVRQIRPHVDGLLVVAGRRRGTFLPSVWDQLPEVDGFVDQLWLKAGLRPGEWPDDLQVSRYRTLEFGE